MPSGDIGLNERPLPLDGQAGVGGGGADPRPPRARGGGSIQHWGRFFMGTRGRVGEGVGNMVDELKFPFFN